MHTLYKIYYNQNCIYLGRTNQPITSRLRGHFFKKPMHKIIDIKWVTRIEICNLNTEADMYLYEIYYINALKPTLNRDDKANDELSVMLPELDWKEYKPPRMDVWLKIIVEQEEADKLQKENERERLQRKMEARKTLKGDTYLEWLEDNGY